MKIGFDLFNITPGYIGGVNTFVFGLIRGLIDNLSKEDSLIILASTKNKHFLEEQLKAKNVSIVVVNVSSHFTHINRFLSVASYFLRNYKIRYWFDLYFRKKMYSLINNAADVFISPATVVNFPAISKKKILCVHDIQHEYYPRNFSKSELVLRWANYRSSAWSATFIQASSQYIKDCLLEKFQFLSPEKIFIAFEGVDLEKFQGTNQERPENLPPEISSKDYIYYPAQLWAHKNHSQLIESLSQYKKKMRVEMPCVLTGQDYGQLDIIQKQIQENGLKKVYYLGKVKFESLVWLYQNCKAVLALGIHESSSLPIREGAVFGVPLIAADIKPNQEASYYFKISLVDSSLRLTSYLETLSIPENSLELGAKDNIQAVMNFNWNAISKKYMEIINR